MSTHPIATYKKSARLFALYQRLPRSKDKAISLTELMNVYGNNPNHYANERKNLENDLTSLNQIFNDVFHSDALMRLPAWGQNISGQTARFYIEPSFRGITILAAGGSWLTLINSTSMVNVRYLLYSAVYKEEITKLPLYKRLLFAFTMNDFMFAVSEESQLKKGYFDYAYTVTAGLVFYVIWNLSTFLGIFLARFLSDIDSLGFDFVIAATFITIILPMIKTKALLLSVVSSAVFAYLFEYFHIGNGLILSALIGMVVGTLFSKSSNDDDKTEDTTTDKAKGERL
ncbi:AzlC family ABC transporter permease [uncultured Psychrobacter sp.]|jgi:predicted branched-subunit amino acid permease|uniref:AzlC family ABC transporter permease n=1 Tax=uncultured Psychrobacter sp. TaxID=259303 RepID=UPI002627DEBD|nr:AzlC family ABC transporter permease [uncultured Psychrobacter sp.]